MLVTLTFPTAENPISDGGQLITSTSPGVNWSGLKLGGGGNLPVAPVDAVAGVAESVDYANQNFGDALAVATGTWAPDQSASVVVSNIPAQPGGFEEIEIHLRTNPTTGAGYEITWAYNMDYILIATWHPTGGYTTLLSSQGSQYAIHPGDTLSASIHGNVITMYTNGVQIAQITDNTFTSGSPGFGFNQGGTNAYGISSFSATDSGSPPTPPPLAPTITSFAPDTTPIGDHHTTATTLTLTGTAEANSTIKLFDGSTFVGQTAVNASGAWNLPDSGLTLGLHNFTATDTDANGTSLPSANFPVTIDSSGGPPPTNLVVNGGFETGNLSNWTLSGNVGPFAGHNQVAITTAAHTGNFAVDMGSVGSNGTITQNVTTVSGQTYTFDFWLANLAGGPNDFIAKVGNITEINLVNAPAQPFTHYSFSFTATSTATPIEFDARQDPADWHLDDISLIPTAGTPPPPPNTVTGTNGNDILTSTTNNNVITTKGGNDLIIFPDTNFGKDTITDFSTGTNRNHDTIQFDHTVLANFAAVQSYAAQVGSNTVITIDANNSVTLTGVHLSNLHSFDFHFA